MPYSLWHAQIGTPGVVVATLPPVLDFCGFSADLGGCKQFSLVRSDEDQDHPCSTPEVARELLCNNNWMADLFTAFCNTQYSDVENAVINCCIS